MPAEVSRTNRRMLDWQSEVFPVLVATYKAWNEESDGGRNAQVFGASGIRINQLLDRRDDDPRTTLAITRLEDGGYVEFDVRSFSGRHTPDDVKLTEKALRLVAGWPGTAEEEMVAPFDLSRR